MALASDAVDQVRRAEVKHEPMLRKQRYSVLKDEANLTAKQAEFIAQLSDSHLKTATHLIAVIYLIAARLQHLPPNPMRTTGTSTPGFA